MTPYATIRADIKSGDLIFSASGHWKARLVRWWTKSAYSHVGVAWCIGARVLVIEAVLSGVRIYPLSLEKSFAWARTPAMWTEAAEVEALSKIGQTYSQFDAVRGGLGFMLPDDGQWQCAELARAILLTCDMPKSAYRGLSNAMLTPESMLRWASYHNNTITQVSNE